MGQYLGIVIVMAGVSFLKQTTSNVDLQLSKVHRYMYVAEHLCQIAGDPTFTVRENYRKLLTNKPTNQQSNSPAHNTCWQR